MASLKISTKVKVEPSTLYGFLKNVGKFPEFMTQVKKLKVISMPLQNRQISEWEVEVEGTTFWWKEEDIYDDQELLWSFHMVEGDFERFQGRWLVKPAGSMSQLIADISFDWGIPRLGQFVGPILERKVKTNIFRMITALRKQATIWSLASYG